MKKNVLIISSEINILSGNATHCKNIKDAWATMCDPAYDIKVIFMCSNNTRIKDISKLLNLHENTSYLSKAVGINIHWDEAHNRGEGIPVYRNYAEQILLHSSVEEFIPITASGCPIFDENNPIWIKTNLDKNRLNFINKDMESSMIKSGSVSYSSIDDGIKLFIEDQYPEEIFNNSFNSSDFHRVYPTSTPEDYIKKGKVNFCHEALIGDEVKSLNYGKNILNNKNTYTIEKPINDILIEEIDEKIFLKDVANYHLIVTPCRQIITYMLMKYACLCEYNPITIGLYGSKLHFRYIKKTVTLNGGIETVTLNGTIPNDGNEFNKILYEWLNARNLLERCVIIFGNYKNVGESNTFVNSKYGYLRSVILLPGCKLTSEEIYQFFLRGCFILDRFKQVDPLFKKEDVLKFIIGEKNAIKDAEFYENQNDEYIQDLIEHPENNDNPNMVFDSVNQNNTSTTTIISSNSTRRSIPMQFKVEDFENENVAEIVRIMKKDSRSEDDKYCFMENLTKSIENSAIISIDHNNPQINLSLFTLKEFRCFKSKVDDDNNRLKNYRFRNYKAYFEQKQSMNNGDLLKGECEIHCCVNQYKLIIENDPKPFINNPNTFYMTFAY